MNKYEGSSTSKMHSIAQSRRIFDFITNHMQMTLCFYDLILAGRIEESPKRYRVETLHCTKIEGDIEKCLVILIENMHKKY